MTPSSEAPQAGGLSVTDLYVYPVKACAGIRLERATLARGGFRDDRRWMIVDPQGRFVSQRELPELGRLRLELGSGEGTATYRMTAPAGGTIVFPRDVEGAPRDVAAPLDVSVWNDSVRALEWPELSGWLSDTLKRPLRGVFVPEDSLRPVNPKRARPDDRVGFADGYPFLLASRESLAELNRRLSLKGEPALDMRRFRPNLVVAGCAFPHEEDEWQTLRIGSAGFRMTKLCDRCSVTTLDPDTSARGKEPLRTLADYRRWDGKVWFAVNLVHDPDHVSRSLSVGDPVEVLTRANQRTT